MNIWGEGSGDALDPDDITRAIRLKRPAKGRTLGCAYVGGLDLGLSRDAAALAVVGIHVGFVDEDEFEPIALTRMEVWKPGKSKAKVDIEEIERTIVALDRTFHLRIGADPWQAAYLIERLQKQGIQIEAVDFVGKNLKSMCSATLEAFSSGNISLYDHPHLIADLKALRVVEKSYGVRLDSPRGVNGPVDGRSCFS